MREPHTWLTMKLDTVPKACFHFLGGPAILAQCLNTFEALWVCVFVRVPFTLILLSPPIGTCWDMLGHAGIALLTRVQVQTNLKHLETHSLQQLLTRIDFGMCSSLATNFYLWHRLFCVQSLVLLM